MKLEQTANMITIGVSHKNVTDLASLLAKHRADTIARIEKHSEIFHKAPRGKEGGRKGCKLEAHGGQLTGRNARQQERSDGSKCVRKF